MKKVSISQLLVSLLFVLGLNANAQKTIVINEVMQSNIDNLMVDKDFPDSWVELYNTTDKDINISGYYFGEKADVTRAWKLPNGSVVPSHGYFLIYCDKEAIGVHTDFRVDAGRAHLYLLDKSGEIVDNLDMEEMPAANIAYGRVTDGADEWQYELAPSAGKANYGPGSADILPEPLFSIKGGVYNEPLTLEITKPEGCPQEALIFYTTNGNEPVPGQAGVKGGMSHKIEISKSTVVRAKIIHPQYKALSPRSTTESFIYHPRAVSMPVISLVSDRDYFYDAEKGILVSNVNDGKPNYMQKWRRPVNVEYFDTLGNVVLNQLGETAVSGVSTREQPQKSMKIYTNKRFGKKNYKGNFWEDKPNVKKVKSFVIRSGGNTSFGARINDAAVQKLFGTHVDSLDWQAYQPVIVYLNGQLLGEFGMRERSDENYVEANYDGLEDVEVADETSYQTPEAGSLFASFRDDYRRSNVTYEELEAQMDMDNFVKTVIAEIYGQNTDFPTNNVSIWRPLEDGGKWRWILKDMDRFGVNLMMYPPSFDMLRYMFEPDDLMYAGMYHFDLYKKMASFPEFRDAFVDKMSVYLGDFLRPEVVKALIDKLDGQITEELKATFSMYNEKFTNHTGDIAFLKKVVDDRPRYLYDQMSSFFGLGKVLKLNVSVDTCKVSINGVGLTEGNFDGSYFAGRPLRLDTGTADYGWKLIVTHTDGTKTETDYEDSKISVQLDTLMKTTNEDIRVSFQVVKLTNDPDDPTEEPEEQYEIPDIA